MSTRVDRLFGWTPFRSAWNGTAMLVDWCNLGAGRMVEPFFYETVAQAMRVPFNLIFQQRTSLAALADLEPGLPLAGFIFHMSRCGSTLVSQALAASERNVVVAEAAPLRSVLTAAFAGRLSSDEAAPSFRNLVNAFAQQRFAYEAQAIVKFMAADVLDIALVRRAFPDVPWIFVTRDPAEIMASQHAAMGADLVRGQIAPSRLGLSREEVWTMEPTVYQAHVLAAFAQNALAAHEGGRGLILDYSELPEALWTKVAPHFGLASDGSTIAMMAAVARRHSKWPARPYASEHDPNRAGAASFRPIADAIVGPSMQALAALRSA